MSRRLSAIALLIAESRSNIPTSTVGPAASKALANRPRYLWPEILTSPERAPTPRGSPSVEATTRPPRATRTMSPVVRATSRT